MHRRGRSSDLVAGAVTVPDTRELVEQVRAAIPTKSVYLVDRDSCSVIPGSHGRAPDGIAARDAWDALAALAARAEEAERSLDESERLDLEQREARILAEARVEELTEALERSENDWTFLFNLADYSDLTPEVLRALAKVNLERARAVLVRESGGQP